MDFNALLQIAGELITKYIPTLIGAIILLFVGLFLIKKIKKILERVLLKAKFDDTLRPFLISVAITTLKVLLVIAVLDMLGAKMTSFIAILSAASLAIGFAFQGTLSNLAGGILLLTLRPFKVGDYIKAAGYEGSVEAIQIFNTTLTTVDNKVVIIPNGGLANTSVVNVNAKSTRRVDLNFGVGYEQNIDKVNNILTDICATHELIFKDPAPFVKLIEHGDSAIVFVVRVWTKTEDYWKVYYDLLETVKKRFDQEGVSIPYPQMDVHMDK